MRRRCARLASASRCRPRFADVLPSSGSCAVRARPHGVLVAGRRPDMLVRNDSRATLPATTWAAHGGLVRRLAVVLVSHADSLAARLGHRLPGPSRKRASSTSRPRRFLGGRRGGDRHDRGREPRVLVVSAWACRIRPRGGWRGALVAALLGLIDDRIGMAPAPKLFFQVFAAWLLPRGRHLSPAPARAGRAARCSRSCGWSAS
jgi:hypothetical protein